jgi:D-alanyl-D-alanine dipeptidase
VQEITLMSDPQVTKIPVEECGEPLVDLRATGVLHLDARLADGDGSYARLRDGLAERLLTAQTLLPDGLRLLVIEGYRPLKLQDQYFTEYREGLAATHPELGEADLHRLANRYVADPEYGPHVAGAAVDLTLMTGSGVEVPMGTEVNASPEDSDDACYTAATTISAEAAHNRRILSVALGAVGLVNYPTEWWHWSYGDRYWAMATGADAAIYGPVTDLS